MLRCDLHVHTNFSFDSSATMEEYAARAVELGLQAVCFTDHIDINPRRDTFRDFPFDRRIRCFERVKSLFGDKVLLLQGYEMGEPHLHPKETAFLRSLHPDMIIGSVHDPEVLDGISDRREYERAYDRVVRDMVRDGDFDVLGHADGLRKWHDDYREDLPFLCDTLALCASRGIVPEINTSSMRRAGTPPMPGLDAIARYISAGGKYVCVNSDAHTVRQLYEFPDIAAQLPRGARQCLFVQGRLLESM